MPGLLVGFGRFCRGCGTRESFPTSDLDHDQLQRSLTNSHDVRAALGRAPTAADELEKIEEEASHHMQLELQREYERLHEGANIDTQTTLVLDEADYTAAAAALKNKSFEDTLPDDADAAAWEGLRFCSMSLVSVS